MIEHAVLAAVLTSVGYGVWRARSLEAKANEVRKATKSIVALNDLITQSGNGSKSVRRLDRQVKRIKA